MRKGFANTKYKEGNELDMKAFADKGIINLGNLHRVAKVMKRAAAGEKISVGFFGGSITRGAHTTVHENCYAYLVYQWWVNKFEKSNITYVNGGIGGTTSQFGVARVNDDMLDFNPDFVITEFCVNDKEEDLFLETYEGLVRKILLYKTEPAILILNNVRYNTGINAQKIHNQIGMAYDLPIVSIKDSLYREVEAGRIVAEDITKDYLHPNDLGHKLVANIVINALEKIYYEVMANNIPNNYEIPIETITQNRFMTSVRYNNKNYSPIMKDFYSDCAEQQGKEDKFKNGWIGSKVGASIHFEVTGEIIAVQYRKSPRTDAPVATAVIDGDTEHTVTLDVNNSTTKGDSLFLLNILESKRKKHTIDIIIVTINEAIKDKFYLAAIIVA